MTRYWLADKPEADKKPIYARSGWEIPQEKLDLMHIEKLEVGLVRIRANEHKKHFPNLKIRSVSSHAYNCMGLIFASRRSFINIEHIYDILREDGYQAIRQDELVVGDLVLYKYDGEPAHIAVVVQITPIRPIQIVVLSRWGIDGEFEHFIGDVPAMCGQPMEFYTERVL